MKDKKDQLMTGGPQTGGTGFQPVRRRNLPHWEIGGSTYFITFRVKKVPLPPSGRQLVLNCCRYFDGQRYHLWCANVLPDHVHLLLTPLLCQEGQWYPLAKILHSIKSYSALQVNKLMGRQGAFWLDESYDRIVRDEAEFLEKWQYIRTNAIKHGYCSSVEEWDGLYEASDQSTGWQPVSPV